MPGSPDAACALVSEAIIDAYLERDVQSRLRIEVMGGYGAIFVSGMAHSSADVDVSVIVRRTLGQLGCGSEIEPFVSIETVPAITQTATVTVTGFACDETEEKIPLPAAYARRIAAACETYRQTDEQGFWLGSDVEGSILLRKNSMPQIFLQAEHGTTDLAQARTRLSAVTSQALPGSKLRLNDTGPVERRGFQSALGNSARWPQAYGAQAPSASLIIGLDPHHPAKAGSWLARAAARKLVANGHHAALVSVVYEPGRKDPFAIMARDESGKRIEQELPANCLHLGRVMQDWWREGLNQEAARYQLIGGTALPWET